MSEANEVSPSDQRERVERLVMLHYLPELPGPERRECVVELGMTGEWLTAKYNEVTDRWMFAYGSPVESVARNHVTKWTYLDELFAA
jgi:hypothetical protein